MNCGTEQFKDHKPSSIPLVIALRRVMLTRRLLVNFRGVFSSKHSAYIVPWLPGGGYVICIKDVTRLGLSGSLVQNFHRAKLTSLAVWEYPCRLITSVVVPTFIGATSPEFEVACVCVWRIVRTIGTVVVVLDRVGRCIDLERTRVIPRGWAFVESCLLPGFYSSGGI